MEEKAKEHLFKLCSFGAHRRLGSAGNKQAVEYFHEQVKDLGFQILTDEFDCLDHEIRSVSLTTGDTRINVQASPYTMPVDVTAELVAARNMVELEAAEYTGKILLMKDDLCKEQLMPKNFVFYNPDHHKKIYSVLEERKPAAIITATGKDLQMVGNIYPFNVFEDGDFDIPSGYTKDVIGDELEKFEGDEFTIKIDASRIDSKGNNVILRKNPNADRKMIVMAHIDTKDGTPGASDNASGTVVLMLLAELLKDYDGKLGVEIIAMNGEDNYSVAGEMDYLKRFGDQMEKILLAVNIDDVGHGGGRSSFSFYNVPDDVKEKVTTFIDINDTTIEGEPWYAGDHMIFVQSSVPSIAITNEKCWDLMATITHTPDDIPENINASILVDLAEVLKEIITNLAS
jgi:aminopeptidase YwaD